MINKQQCNLKAVIIFITSLILLFISTQFRTNYWDTKWRRTSRQSTCSGRKRAKWGFVTSFLFYIMHIVTNYCSNFMEFYWHPDTDILHMNYWPIPIFYYCYNLHVSKGSLCWGFVIKINFLSSTARNDALNDRMSTLEAKT